MQSKGNTLEHLLATHFPNSLVTENMTAPAAAAAAHCTKQCDWWVALEVVIYGRVEWAINCFVPYKSPGIGGVFPALLQEEWRIIVLTWSGFSMPAWRLSMFKPYGFRLK